MLLGELPSSSLPGLSTYDYEYYVSDAGELSKLVVTCGEENCHGVFHWELGGYAGGQAFFGYALSETLQIGRTGSVPAYRDPRGPDVGGDPRQS